MISKDKTVLASFFGVVCDYGVGNYPYTLFTRFDGGRPLKQGLLRSRLFFALSFYGEVISCTVWLQSLDSKSQCYPALCFLAQNKGQTVFLVFNIALDPVLHDSELPCNYPQLQVLFHIPKSLLIIWQAGKGLL